MPHYCNFILTVRAELSSIKDLRVVACADFSHASEALHVPGISGGIAIGSGVARQLRPEVKLLRQPVGLTGIHFEAIKAVISADLLHPCGPPVSSLRSGKVVIARRSTLPPAGLSRLPVFVADNIRLGRFEARTLKVDERMNPQSHSESLRKIRNAYAGVGCNVRCPTDYKQSCRFNYWQMIYSEPTFCFLPFLNDWRRIRQRKPIFLP